MRWHNPDPYQEFHSPYCAMGNDWVNLVDPSGGSTGGPSGGGDPFGAAFRTILNSIHLMNQMRALNSPERIIPAPSLEGTRYGIVLNNLLTNNIAFNNNTSHLKGKVDWHLTRKNFKRYPDEKTPQLARTMPTIPGDWVRDGRTDLPISGGLTSFLMPMNESKISGLIELNDLGRALVIIHEGVHAEIIAFSNEELGVYTDHHAPFGNEIHQMVFESLVEFVSDNNLPVLYGDLELISWNGLQGTPAFNKRFGIVVGVTSIEYMEGINHKIDSLIFSSPLNSMYNVKD